MNLLARNLGLGDIVSSFSNAIRVSKDARCRMKFSLNPKINKWNVHSIKLCIQRLEVAKLLYEYEPYIEIIDHRLVEEPFKFIKGNPIGCLNENSREFHTEPGLCCTHLSGKTWTIEREYQEVIVSILSRSFLRVVDCNQLPLMEAVSLTTKCELFVGIDSGFSHVAHAAGKEVHLIRTTTGNKIPSWMTDIELSSIEEIRKWHGLQKNTIVYDNHEDFTRRFNEPCVVPIVS